MNGRRGIKASYLIYRGPLARRMHVVSGRRNSVMLMTLAIILAIAWLLGFGVFNVASAALHILIVVAVVALVVHFVQGRGARLR